MDGLSSESNQTFPRSTESSKLQEKSGGHKQVHVYDTAKWTFKSEPQEMSRLEFLPIAAIVILVLCFVGAALKWSHICRCRKGQSEKDPSEDAENGDENNSENREACSEDASLYDTVSAFKLLENGCTIQLSESHPYHDTVTSYQSLLLQKADGSQYDSVKSYKAFLQKVTQNKDLAVEVKLLENYPLRSKSVEHCVVLEEESSEKSGEVTAHLLPNQQLSGPLPRSGNKICPVDKKRPRHRRASGDLPPAMRKRSASNPISRRAAAHPAGSLPSIHCTVLHSSDSEDDAQQSVQTDRRKLWAERKKMSRSASGGKISKNANNSILCNEHSSTSALMAPKRQRHFSADGVKHSKKAAVTSSHRKNGLLVNGETVTKDSRDKRTHLANSTKTETQHFGDESSSENPISSNSSDSDILSDAVVSETDEETKRNTLISNASDDPTLDNDVFFSLDSGAELMSSSEILKKPKQPMSETKLQIAKAKEEFFKNNLPLFPPSVIYKVNSDTAKNDLNRSNHSHSIQLDDPTTTLPIDIPDAAAHCYFEGVPDTLLHTSKDGVSTLFKSPPSSETSCVTIDELKVSELDDPKGGYLSSSPQRVPRFQVTSVNSQCPNLNSD